MVDPLYRLILDDWVMKVKLPGEGAPSATYVLLHGLTGDENAMWIFASRLPKDALIIAPRGIFSAPGGGYAWYSALTQAWPWVDDFQTAVEALVMLLHRRSEMLQRLSVAPVQNIDRMSANLVGFSQGAACAYTLALTNPWMIGAVAGLSGFLPTGADPWVRNRPLTDKPVFIAHGAEDSVVPVEQARQAVELLTAAGAKVTYCEDQMGHKTSLGCLNRIKAFFSEI